MNQSRPVVFRESPGRWLLSFALIMVLTLLLIRGLFLVAAVAAGASLTFGDFVEAVLVSLAATAAALFGAWVVRRRHRGWVSMSAEGLEFASPRHRATFLPWAGIASVRRRYPGPFTQLLVTPATPDAFFFAPAPGRTPQLRAGELVIDVGMMTPGPAALLAELDHHRNTLV